jgi:hypothetical protein
MVSHRRALIETSLAAAAMRIGDPVPLVYARLFATQPAIAPLFCNDKSGSVRGEMLGRAFDTILDFVGDDHFTRLQIGDHAQELGSIGAGT